MTISGPVRTGKRAAGIGFITGIIAALMKMLYVAMIAAALMVTHAVEINAGGKESDQFMKITSLLMLLL